MKPYLIKHSSLLLLAITVITTMAFRPLPKKTNTKAGWGTLFVYTPQGLENEFSPAAYDQDPFFDPSDYADCPGSSYLCAIETTEIYTSGSLAGQPKVDDYTTLIYWHINYVLAWPTIRDGSQDSWGNIVWVRN